jgi:uncharacterized protein YodC (DUF2158 family)
VYLFWTEDSYERVIVQAFNKGDIVQLKSGGPKMTVSELIHHSGNYLVKWFAGSKMESAQVSPEALQLYVEPEK